MRRPLLSLATVAVTLSALVATSGSAHAAVSPHAAVSALTLEGATGSFLLPSGSVSFAGDQVSADADADTVVLDGGDGAWRADLEAPTNAPLTKGSYPVAAAPAAGVVGLAILGDGRSCDLKGSVVVHEVTRDAGTQAITSLAATYTVSCNGTGFLNVGELRYASTVDYERFGVLGLGKDSATRTVTVTATSATTFGTSTLEGDGAPVFRIASDGCSGADLQTGQACTVKVWAHPRTVGGSASWLRLPSPGGDRVVSLTVAGVETAEGEYTAVPPQRVLDTRTPTGVKVKAPIGPARYIDVQVSGRAGVPSVGVSAVVLNVTAVKPTSRGYLTVYPAGRARPVASSVNFSAGWVGANLVTVPVAAGGKVRVYNAAGSTNVAADVVGYYHAAASTADPASPALAEYSSISPVRVVDTRTDDWDREPLPGRTWLWQALDFGDDFNERVQAFAVNVTVVGPRTQGHLTTFDGDGGAIPATSTLNFTAGRTVPNMAIIKVGRCGTDCEPGGESIPRFGVYNASLDTAHVVVDLVGYYFTGEPNDRGWRFSPLATPQRFVDSRKAQGLATNLGRNAAAVVTTPASIAGWNTMAVVTNTTAAQPTTTTVLTLWSNDGSDRPGVSNLNPYAGQLVSNMTITEVGSSNDFRVHNLAGTTPLVVDAAGTMEYYPALIAGEPPTTSTASDGSALRPSGSADRTQRGTSTAAAPTPGARGRVVGR